MEFIQCYLTKPQSRWEKEQFWPTLSSQKMYLDDFLLAQGVTDRHRFSGTEDNKSGGFRKHLAFSSFQIPTQANATLYSLTPKYSIAVLRSQQCIYGILGHFMVDVFKD